MSDQQSQTAANTPSEPVLCKMGCGFFGNGGTGNCCSKCWRELQKKEGAEVVPTRPNSSTSVREAAVQQSQDVKPSPMECEEPPKVESLGESEVAAPAPKKRSKKKKSYKAMMAGMLASSPPRDAEKDKEVLRQVTGGGAFSKIDKI